MDYKKKILITFLGNINYDTRCRNLFDTLKANNFDVKFLGFDWLTENYEPVTGEITIYKLHKGFLSLSFYLNFIWHIKKFLFYNKADIIFAEEIYSLPFAVIFGKLKKAKIYYDCRELFGYLAGLKGKKLKQSFWKWIEKIFIKKVDKILVTGKMDEDFIRKEFKVNNTIIIRNLPRYYKPVMVSDLHSNLKIDKSKKIILYQGVLLKGRGIEIVFEILNDLPDFVFVIAGGGEFENYYKDLAVKMNLTKQVFFLGKVKQDELYKKTAAADVGIALIENLSLSYYYALPNKLFEYIMAEVPVVVSNLPQMKEVVEKNDVGFAVDAENKEEIISAFKKLAEDKTIYESKKQNCKIASQELNWEKEVTTLLQTL